MARLAVVQAVTARFQANWTLCPIYEANTVWDTPEDGSPFCILRFPSATVKRFPVSDRYYRETGGFHIALYSERGIGVTQPLTWVEQMSQIFRDQTFGGVVCRVPSSPFVHDDDSYGSYFVTSTVVPYQFNFGA